MISRHLEYAIVKARSIPYQKSKSRHYAILVDKRGKIVSEGFNSYSCTHPTMKNLSQKLGFDGKEYRHAEFHAVLKDKRNRGHSLYVARVGANGQPMPSSPCLVCYSLIKSKKNIKQIYWT